jgi:hypothetical protein
MEWIAPELCRPSPSRAGPVGPVDDNGGMHMLWLCPSLVLQASITISVMIPSSVTAATDGPRALDCVTRSVPII